MTNKNELVQVLSSTPQMQIADLPFVQEKFIANYNACHSEKIGELVYSRNVVHFKQLIGLSKELQSADQFSLYACFVTAAVNGYSLDPQDNEIYMLAMGGKAVLWRQAGAHIKRLVRTNQIKYADQAKLVYKGDAFQVENGKVVKHVENFESETITGGYIRMILSDGTDRFFIYRNSDFMAWKSKSKQPNGDNWSGGIDKQPNSAFLRTKIVLHSSKEKCWATGMSPIGLENIESVVVDDVEHEVVPPPQPDPMITSDNQAFASATVTEPKSVTINDDAF